MDKDGWADMADENIDGSNDNPSVVNGDWSNPKANWWWNGSFLAGSLRIYESEHWHGGSS